MVFDTFLILAMAQAAEQTTINATPVGLRFKQSIGYVMFQCHKTGKRFMVDGMTIRAGKRAWAQYNLAFKGRPFRISLNAEGRGVHYAEGIKWNVSIKDWVSVPLRNKYLTVFQQHDGFERTHSVLRNYVWDPSSVTWLCDEHNVSVNLFRQSGTDFPFNCLHHRSNHEPCYCEGVDEFRNSVKGFDILYESKFCDKCRDFYSEGVCPKCRTLFEHDYSDDSSGDWDDSNFDIMEDSPNTDFCHTQICQFRRLGMESPNS